MNYYRIADVRQALINEGVKEPHAGWAAECAQRVPEGRLEAFAKAFAENGWDLEAALKAAKEAQVGGFANEALAG